MIRRGVAAALVALALPAPAGCALDPELLRWDHNWLIAERQVAAGDYENALARLRMLEQKSLSLGDRYEVRLQIGDVLAAMGRRREALDSWYVAARLGLTRMQRAMAFFHAARLLYWHGDTQEQGLQALVAIVDRYPDTVAGLRSLDFLTEHWGDSDSGRAYLLRFLRERYRRMPDSPLADNIVYRTAILMRETGTREGFAGARLLCNHLVARFPRSGLWDDAMFLRADAEHGLGLYREAIETWRRIVQQREPAYLLGNYETMYYHRSQWRIAEVLLHDLELPEEAVLELETFVREYRFSGFFDDALYQLAVVYLRLGRPIDAERTLARLATERPESRFNRRAAELLRTGVDPGKDAPWSPRPEGRRVPD